MFASRWCSPISLLNLYRFYFASQVSTSGGVPGKQFSGPAHAAAYWDLINSPEQKDWDYRYAAPALNLLVLIFNLISSWLQVYHAGLRVSKADGPRMRSRGISRAKYPLVYDIDPVTGCRGSPRYRTPPYAFVYDTLNIYGIYELLCIRHCHLRRDRRLREALLSTLPPRTLQI